MIKRVLKGLIIPFIVLAIVGISLQNAVAEEVKEFPMGIDLKEFEKEYEKIHGEELKRMAEENNPAEIYLEDGQELFHKIDGSKGKSCASCHGQNGERLKGVATTYPKYDAVIKGILTLPMQINRCRENNMGAKHWKYGKHDIVAVELFVKSLSNGMPIKIDISGPARPFYDAGKKIYYMRLGEWNWSCAHCHVLYAGRRSRAEFLPPTQVLADHWPAYRLAWGAVAGENTGTIQRRFKGCIKNARVPEDKLPALESEFMRNLEFYITAENNGRLIQVPGFRR